MSIHYFFRCSCSLPVPQCTLPAERATHQTGAHRRRQSRQKMEKSEELDEDFEPRISFFMQLMNWPSISLILKWIMVENSHDIILIFNQKIQKFDHVITRFKNASGEKCQNSKISKNQVFPVSAFCWSCLSEKKGLFWFGWLVLFYIPLSQILTFTGFAMAERCLYPITVIIGLLVAKIFEKIKFGTNRTCLLVLFFGFLIFQSSSRVQDWRNDFQLSKSGSEVGSIKSKINLASHFSKNKKFEKSISILDQVIQSHQSSDIYYNL